MGRSPKSIHIWLSKRRPVVIVSLFICFCFFGGFFFLFSFFFYRFAITVASKLELYYISKSSNLHISTNLSCMKCPHWIASLHQSIIWQYRYRVINICISSNEVRTTHTLCGNSANYDTFTNLDRIAWFFFKAIVRIYHNLYRIEYVKLWYGVRT